VLVRGNRRRKNWLKRGRGESGGDRAKRLRDRIDERVGRSGGIQRGRRGTKKAGAIGSGLEKEALRLLSEQHVARMLDRLGDRALLTGGKVRVLAGQDLACVGHVTPHDLGGRERNLFRRETLLCGLFGRGAHSGKRGPRHRSSTGMSTRIFRAEDR